MLLALWSAKIIRCTDEEIRWSGVARHGLMRTCSYEWMRCCDGGVPRPDGVVRAGARKYVSDWKLKLYVSFPVLLSMGANTS